MTIFLIAFTAFMWLSIFWFIPSEETPLEKEFREIHRRNMRDVERWRDEEVRRSMKEKYQKGIEGYNNYLKLNK